MTGQDDDVTEQDCLLDAKSHGQSDETPARHFYSKFASAFCLSIAGLVFGLGLIESLSGINLGSAIFGFGMMLGGGWGLYRTPRAGLWTDRDGVRIVALFRTQIVPWEQVLGFAEKRTFYDKGGAFLAVTTIDGRSLSAFTASTSNSQSSFSTKTLAAMETARSQATQTEAPGS